MINMRKEKLRDIVEVNISIMKSTNEHYNNGDYSLAEAQLNTRIAISASEK